MLHIEPNWFAYCALGVWPVVALYLYVRLPVAQATLWTILAAHLLLPVRAEIKFDMVPAFDKSSIPNLAALLGCALFARKRPKIFHGFGIAEGLIVVLVCTPFVTSMLNTDPIPIGDIVLPGVGYYDALSAAVAQFIFIIPFFLGRQFLRDPADIGRILWAMVIAGLVYSLPMLFEIKMSPQLHTWVYGYFPHQFAQQVRDGGFRPVVFMGHGLLVAFFAMSTAVASAALWRARVRIARLPSYATTAYLGAVLVLCKTLGALIYGVVLIPLVRWASLRLQLRIATLLVMVALAYPLLRVADVVPTQDILGWANNVSAERAESLRTRFDQEKLLLTHAWDRKWFGWGRFGRSRVYFDNGEDRSITDGEWINTMGTFGLVGFAAEFGL